MAFPFASASSVWRGAFLALSLSLLPQAFALPKPSEEAVREYAPVHSRSDAKEKWSVYQRGPQIALAIDRGSMARGADGLIYFSHEERFPREMYDKNMDVRFFIRRTRVVADCDRDRVAFIRADFFNKSRQPVFQGMFDLQKHQWAFIEAQPNSTTEAMLTTACTLARHPAYVPKN